MFFGDWKTHKKEKVSRLCFYTGWEVFLIITYNKKLSVYDFFGNVIEGEIQSNKHKLVVAWIEIHHEELVSNWDLLQKGKKYFKITPLR